MVDKREALKGVDNGKLKDGSIALAFQRTGKAAVTYAGQAPTKAKIKAFHIRWIAESQ